MTRQPTPGPWQEIESCQIYGPDSKLQPFTDSEGTHHPDYRTSLVALVYGDNGAARANAVRDREGPGDDRTDRHADAARDVAGLGEARAEIRQGLVQRPERDVGGTLQAREAVVRRSSGHQVGPPA